MRISYRKQVANAIVSWLSQARPPAAIPLSDFERIRYEIKPGDVVLVEGRTRASEVIKLITQSRWSHAALYIGHAHSIEDPVARAKVRSFYDGQTDVQLIIESELGMGTIVRPLNVYDRDHIRICRPRDVNFSDAQKVINFATERLGTGYDIRQIFDLMRFLFPWWVMPRRWRSSLFTSSAGNTTKTVCSTMIAEAFASIQYPILPLVKRSENHEVKFYRRNPKLCTPSDFDYSPYFDIIKYPFIDFAHSQNHYRLLPWEDRSQLKEPRVDSNVTPLRRN